MFKIKWSFLGSIPSNSDPEAWTEQTVNFNKYPKQADNGNVNFNNYPSDSHGNGYLRNTTEFPEECEPCAHSMYELSPNIEAWKDTLLPSHLSPGNVTSSAPCLHQAYFELNSSSTPSIDSSQKTQISPLYKATIFSSHVKKK